MLVKVKWKIGEDFFKSWESRATVRKYFPRSTIENIDYTYNRRVVLEQGSDLAVADKAIIICAIRCATRYDEYTAWLGDWEIRKDLSPSPDAHIKEEADQ